MTTILQAGKSLFFILLLGCAAVLADDRGSQETANAAAHGATGGAEITASAIAVSASVDGAIGASASVDGAIGASTSVDAAIAASTSVDGAIVDGAVTGPVLAGPADIPIIDTAVMLDYLAGRGPFTLLDARSAEEFAIGHVYNAVNVPHDDVENYVSTLPADRAAPLVTYCKTGKRAPQLAARLRELGYSNVRVLGPNQMFWSDTAPMFNCGVPEPARPFLPESP